MENAAKRGMGGSDVDKLNDITQVASVVITREQLKYMRQRVQELNDVFILLGIESVSELLPVGNSEYSENNQLASTNRPMQNA